MDASPDTNLREDSAKSAKSSDENDYYVNCANVQIPQLTFRNALFVCTKDELSPLRCYRNGFLSSHVSEVGTDFSGAKRILERLGEFN